MCFQSTIIFFHVGALKWCDRNGMHWSKSQGYKNTESETSETNVLHVIILFKNLLLSAKLLFIVRNLSGKTVSCLGN